MRAQKAFCLVTMAAFLIAWAFPLEPFAGEPHPALPQPGRLDGLGVNIHFTDPRPGEAEMLSAGGFRWVRMDFSWSATERRQGQYDFSAYERLLAALQPHGIRVLFILDYSNRLYEQNRSVVTEQGREAFARWAAAAAARFKGRGILWEIWNEPNIAGFWKPQPNVQDYTKLALATSRAIRQVAPNEAIVGPATSRIDLEFLEGCFQSGLLQWWDAVTVHPYRQSAPETAASEYRELRRLIAQYAPPGKTIPILSGEWGYSSVWKGFDPPLQGKMLARQWLFHLSQGVPLSIWYDWHDDGPDPHEPEHHFGTVAFEYHADRTPVYDPKPAYRAAKTLTSVLDGFQFRKRIATGNADDYVLLFGRGDQLRLAAWTTGDAPRVVRIPSSRCRFEVISHLGTPGNALSATGGHLSITLGDAPQYLIAQSANEALAAAVAAHPLAATLLPACGKTLTAHITNLADAPFSGRVQLVHIEGIEPLAPEQPLELPANGGEATVRFPLASTPAREYQAALRIADSQGNQMLQLPARRVVFLPDEFLTEGRIVADGDAEVSCDWRMVPSKAPQPLGDCNVPAVKITYRFDPGWKFLRLVPPAGNRGAISGRPVAFGIWVYGDAGGCSPRMRVRDASGQTWQPTGDSITWDRWRFVELPLDPSAGHWGGDDDGVIHFPLHWDTIFLLDNVSRERLEGTIYVAAPVVLYTK